MKGGIRTGLWLEVRVQLRSHHKLNSSARTLGIPRVYLLGHLVSLWLGALEFAEDGDLWRGNEEKTLRFIESLAELVAPPERFVEVLRLDGWLDEWRIHDWLDYAGKYLYSRYKSHNRKKLLEIWAKHGRVYGRDGEESDDEDVDGMRLGYNRDANGMSLNLPLTHNPNNNLKPLTLNPSTQDRKEMKSPKRGVGENAATSGDRAEPQPGKPPKDIPPPANRAEPPPKPGAKGNTGFLISCKAGSRVKGFIAAQDELTGDAVPLKQVFEAFMPLLSFHALYTMEAFQRRVKHCKTTPSRWMMLFLDKIHAVYRDRGEGTTLSDGENADPVAMTVAGLVPKKGGRRHLPTEAARQLFLEIMLEHAKTEKGEKSKWTGRMSAPAITLELDRRKGKAEKTR